MSERVQGDMSGSPLKTYPIGRHCVECGARISIYNGGDMCRPCKTRLRTAGGSTTRGQQLKIGRLK